MCVIVKNYLILMQQKHYLTDHKTLIYFAKLLKDFLSSPSKNNWEKYPERAVSTFLCTVSNLNGFFYIWEG
jgi:hypothetical protein